VQSRYSLELEVKKSRFLATALPLAEGEAAERRLGELCHPDASHNCWAWRSGDAYRSHDDGEPGGTAGRPIRAAIDGAGIDRVLLVVARWFGGIKLGAGGLVRAYGGAAAECLRLAPKRQVEPRSRLQVQAGFALSGMLYTLAARHAAEILAERHTAAGPCWHIELADAQREAFVRAVGDASRGQARILPDAD
jgi:putative IMPACT (imprinted ancient) family translation regulator